MAPDRRVTSAGRADALVTAAPRAPLGVLVADCVPFLLADPAAGSSPRCMPVGRGVAAGVVAETVAAMAGPARGGSGIRGRRAGDLRRVLRGPAALQDEMVAVSAARRVDHGLGDPGLDLPVRWLTSSQPRRPGRSPRSAAAPWRTAGGSRTAATATGRPAVRWDRRSGARRRRRVRRVRQSVSGVSSRCRRAWRQRDATDRASA